MTDNPLTESTEILSFAIWPAGTKITLCNVPWDMQYARVNRFANRAALNSYIDRRGQSGKVINNLSYVRVSEPIMLEDPFNTLWKYNYIRVSQPAQPTTVGTPDVARDYYYFITDIEHVAPNTTMVRVALDFWQTFIYDVTFGQCFVERSHLPIAQSNQMADRGRRYLTAPEGLDTGAAYVTRRQHEEILIGGGRASAYVIYATCDLNGEFWKDEEKTIPSTPPVTLPYLPFGAASGIGVWVCRSNDIYSILGQLPAHIQQTIVTIINTPALIEYYPGYQYGDGEGTITALKTPPNFSNTTGGAENFGVKTFPVFTTDWRDAMEDEHIPAPYKHLHKFKTFPYCLIEMHHGADNALTLRPEQFDTFGIYIRSELSAHLAEPSLRAIPLNYNGMRTDPRLFTTSGILPRLGVTNDNAAIAMAASANVRAYQSEARDWANEKALRGNQQSYDSATRAIDAAQAQGNLSGQYATDVQARNAGRAMEDAWINGGVGLAQGLATGAGGGAAIGGPGGALIGGALGAGNGLVSGGLGVFQADRQNRRAAEDVAAANAQAQASLDVSKGVSIANRDATKSLADWAARGDYQQSVLAQQAAIQDTLNTPPSVAAMPQGSVDAVTRERFGVFVNLKMIDPATVKRIGDFWLRYGYAVGEWITPPADLMCMQEFTYWKMTECVIRSANIPEIYKTAIRGVLEKGVTVHRDPDTIGANVANPPIMGEYY